MLILRSWHAINATQKYNVKLSDKQQDTEVFDNTETPHQFCRFMDIALDILCAGRCIQN